MDQLIKQIIEEKYASLQQAKYFHAKASDKSLSAKERKVWKDRANEFDSKTNFKKIPKKVKTEVDEIVDEDGNIDRNPKPINANVKGITSYSTTDGGAGRRS